MNLLSRGRARLRVCLLVLTVCLAGAAFSAPSASATNFAVLFGGSQGGSDQDATFLWSGAGSPQAQNLSIVYGAGYWPHMHKIQRMCTLAQATASSCPSASRIATVMATFSVQGSILPAVRSGYLALERKRSGELMGYDVVLVLDQNGSYRGYAGRRRVEVLKSNKLGDPNANTRLDLGAPPELVRRSGATTQARLTGLAITTRKRWMRLPTVCDGSSSVSAVTALVDGSVESVLRTPAVTGCSSLTVDTPIAAAFNPREVSLDKSVPWKATARIGDHADGERTTDPRTVTMKMMGAPKIGEATAVFTTSCTRAQAEAAACPPESRLGEFCVESSPAGEVACGDAWNSGVRQPGSAAGGAGGSVGLLLSLTKFSDGSGGGGGGAGGLLWVGDGSVQIVPGTGESILTINDLPQADLHAFRMSGDNPLFEANSSCGNNPLHTRVTGWNGSMREQTGVIAIACTPGIETTDARDDDSDGDGIADKMWRPANFKINFRVTDRGEGVDPSSISCSFKGWDGTIKGSPRVDDDDGDGLDDSCSISSATGGAGVLEIRAADRRGHVTVLKLGYSVDVWLPAVQTVDPIDDDADGDGLADDEFREPNFSVAFEATDEGSGIDDDATTCGAEDQKGIPLPKITPKIAKENHGKFRCIVEDADDGPIVIVATVRDVTGHVTVLKRQWTVDSQGPVMNTTEPEDEDCDARADELELSCFRQAFFDVFFSATDAGSGVDWSTADCRLVPLGGTLPGGTVLQTARVVDSDGDGTPDACRVENAPEGDVEVDIRAADWRGHVTVLKLSYTVDTTPPAIAIDEPGVHFAPGAFFDVFTDLGFTIDGLRAGDPGLDGYGCDFHLEGDFDSISRPTSNCAPAGEGGPPAMPLKPGLNHAQLRVMDRAGNMSMSFFDVFYDNVHPEITLDDGRDQDCDDETEDVAPTCYRQAFFDVFFSASDAGVGVDWTTAACRGMVVAKPGSAPVHGRFIDDDGDGVPEGCGFDDLEEGEYDIEISVADWRGHVTVLKLHYGVDATPPASEFTDPPDQDADGDSVADQPYRAGSFDILFSLTDEGGSGVDPSASSCEFRLIGGALPGGAVISAAVSMVDTDSDGDVDACRVSDAPEGPLQVEIVLRDRAGNSSDPASRAIREWIVDTTPPDIAIDEPGVHFALEGFFDVFTDLGFTIDGLHGHRDVGGYRCDFNLDGDFDSISRPTSNCAPAGDGGPPALPLRPGLNHAQLRVMDAAGNVSEAFFDVFYDTVGPVIELTDTEDEDCDGGDEEIALTCFRPAFFDIFYTATDAGVGVDWITNTCAIRMLDGELPGGSTPPSASVVDSDGDGTPDVCRIENAPEGDVEIDIRAADHRGHVTVLKAHYTVDTTPPAVSFFDPGSEPFIPDPWLHFDVVDANPGSSVCSLVNLDTGEAVGEDEDCDGFTDSAGESCDPADPAAGDCKRTYAFPHVFDQKGRYQATVTHTDKAGNSGTNTMIFRVENDPPTLTLTNGIDDDCDSTTDDTARCYRPAPIDIPFEAVDEGSGVAAVSCTATLADGTSRDLVVNHHGSSQSTGHRVSGSCESGDLPDGDTTIELKAVDFRGHVTVLKLSVTVDSTDPAVQFFNPGSEPFTWNPPLNPPTLRFDLDEANPGLSRCEIVSLDGVVLSTETCGDGYTNQAGETCDPADSAAGDCKRTYAFPHVLDQRGRFMARVVHTDRASNASFASVRLEVADPDLDPPAIAIDEPGVHFALDPFFDVFSEIGFSIDGMRPGDPDLDPYRCDFNLDGDFDSISRPTSNCAPGAPFELPEGLNHVGMRVTDAAGNTADAFFDIVVDTTPPVVSFFDPGSEPFTGFPRLSFAVDDANPGSSVCSLVNLDTGEAVGEDEDCDGYADSAGRPCEPDDPIGSDLCQRVFVLPHVLESSGRFRATVVHTDAAGNAGSSSVDFTVDATGPVIELTDGRDDDCDGAGDEIALTCFRPAFFDVFYSATDAYSGVDWITNTCAIRMLDGELPGVSLPPSASVVDSDGDGTPDVCRIENAPDGDVEVEIRAADHRGHVTVLKAHYTVDTTPPAVDAIDPRDQDSDGDGFAEDRWRAPDFDVVHRVDDPGHQIHRPGYVARRTCLAALRGQTVVIENDADEDADGNWVCRHRGLAEGDWDISLEADDEAGNVGRFTVAVSVDGTGPAIRVTRAIDDDDDDDGVADYPERLSNFELWFDTYDAGIGVDDSSVTCSAQDQKGIPLPKHTAKIARESHGRYSCSIENAPAGPAVVVVSVADSLGHVTVLKLGVVIVEPAIELTNPADIDADGDGAADEPLRPASFDVAFRIVNDLDGSVARNVSCVIVRGWDPDTKRAMTVVDTDGDEVPDVCRVDGASSGKWKIDITGVPVSSSTKLATVDVTVDADPPEVEFFAPGSEPFGTWPILRFRADDANPGQTRCSISTDDPTVPAIEWPCDGYSDASGAACDPADPAVTDCERSFFSGQPTLPDPAGRYFLRATHTDQVGNTSSATFTYETDRPPSVEFVGAAFTAPDLAPDFRFLVTDGDPNGVTNCFVLPEVGDEVLVGFSCGGVWTGSTCDCQAQVPQPLVDGTTYRLRVEHRTQAGRVARAEHTFRIETSPPAA